MTRSRVLQLSLLFAAALALLAGCHSTSSAASGAAATSSPAHSSPAPSQPPSVKVYFAESGDVGGTVVYLPACHSGCLLSGDSTAALWDMTWTTWNATEAVGTGTEKIDDCNPNCAAGTQHAVKVTVTLSKPVKAACETSGTKRYWSRAAFVWPDGLPSALSGENGPTNPFNYSGISEDKMCA